MKADFSRTTFDQRLHATAVLKQQGRVDLDADWNEQRDIEEHLRTTALIDVIGAAGAPIDADAFALTPIPDELSLSAGRYYLDGVLVECDADVSIAEQPDLPAGAPWIRRSDGTWVVPPATGPAGVYVAWLDVWSQHRGAVEVEELREVALGGPDTATRARTVWQVRLLQAGTVGATVGCADEPPGWDELTSPSTGTLEAWADPVGAPANDCVIPASSPYRGLDNQLYRVEVLAGGAPGDATFVWSRDNGSVVAAWEATDAEVLTVVAPGRDGSDGFSSGCWIELTDDAHELMGEPGTLVQVDRAEGDRLVLRPGTATGSIDHADFEEPRVRRWDGHGTVPDDGSEIALELGIRVRFGHQAGATYRTGDHWMFAARSATHAIEWPQTAAGDPVPRTADGPRHHHARLAIVAFDGTDWTVERDCRPLFAPLVDQLSIHYLGGDTQAALPDVADPTTLVPLAHDLVAGVATGGRPIAGARVRFRIDTGNGELAGGATTTTVTTGADGVARTAWSVDSATAHQRVVAELLAEDGTPRGLGLAFSAVLSQAATVAYQPGACAELAGAATVQEAIDRLCATNGGGCETLSLGPENGWREALRSLPEGTDATVCLRPGEYISEDEVVITGLGHIRITGAGPATRVVNVSGEAAIRFVGCASVTVEDLAVTVSRFPEPPIEGIIGALTAIDCAAVDVRRLRIICPAGATHRAACLTVRAGGEGAATAATDRVRIRDCELFVGHGQTGTLIVNAHEVVVADTTFRTPTRPSFLDLGALLADRGRLKRMARVLAGRMVIDRGERLERVEPEGFNTAFRLGNWAVRLNSAVPEREWRALTAANPPSDDDVRDAAAVNAYLARVTEEAVAEPSRVPTLDRQIRGFNRRLSLEGGEELLGGAAELTARRALLMADEVDVSPVTETGRLERKIGVVAEGGAVRFDSPISQDRWEAVLGELQPRDRAPANVAKAVRGAARRLLADRALADRLVPGLFTDLARRDPAVSACGLRIGGAVVGRVAIEGNRFLATAEAVHVGVSAGGGGTRAADSVRVRGNDIRLAVPVEVERAPRAVFVGNAERVVVADNRAEVAGEGVVVGVQVEGVLGPHVVVRDNQLDDCRTGVRLWHHGDPPKPAQWLIADNFTPGATVAESWGPVRVEGNVS